MGLVVVAKVWGKGGEVEPNTAWAPIKSLYSGGYKETSSIFADQ